MQVPDTKSLYKPSEQGVGVVETLEQVKPTGQRRASKVPGGQN